MQTTNTAEAVVLGEGDVGESYFRIIWRKFRKNRLAIAGGAVLLIIIVLAVFAPFFSAHDYEEYHSDRAFMPPQPIRFVDADGRFHFRPFVYTYGFGYDPATFKRQWVVQTETKYFLRFFSQGWEYEVFGIPVRRHLVTVAPEGHLHLLGTDRFGRDLFGRILVGGRISLVIAFFGALFSAIIGSIIGGISGYYGGITDIIVQRTVEFLQSFPQLPLWMAISVAFPPRWPQVRVFSGMVFMFALLGWGWLAREIRAKVLSLRDQDFVLAARGAKASNARVILVHLLPNCLSHIIVVLTLNIPHFILAESTLSFLGLGLQPPMVSWGVLLQKAQNLQTLGRHPWITAPAFFIVITILAFNFLGDGLRDAADPYAYQGAKG